MHNQTLPIACEPHSNASSQAALSPGRPISERPILPDSCECSLLAAALIPYSRV